MHERGEKCVVVNSDILGDEFYFADEDRWYWRISPVARYVA